MGYLIEKQTAAKTSAIIDLTKDPFPKSIFAVGTLGASTIAVQVVDENDAVLALYDSEGVAVVLTATSQPITITSPVRLKFVKGVTGAAAGVMLTEKGV